MGRSHINLMEKICIRSQRFYCRNAALKSGHFWVPNIQKNRTGDRSTGCGRMALLPGILPGPFLRTDNPPRGFHSTTCHEQAKRISLDPSASVSLYQILNVTPSSTQQQIKDSYYKLSMLYHPDRNEGSVDAVAKFRQINEAYEVLGNHSSRKKYDKGLLRHVGLAEDGATVEREAPSEPPVETMKRNPYSVRTGRSNVYDYDAWTRAHYTETFNKKQSHMKQYAERVQGERKDKSVMQIEGLLIFLLFAFLGVYMLGPRANIDLPPSVPLPADNVSESDSSK